MEFIAVIVGVFAIAAADAALQQKVPAYREWRLALTLGPINPALICPHCQQRGSVRTKQVEQKKGVSGGKVAGAALTGGLSLLLTGLSRREKATRATCGACSSTWVF